MHLHGEAAAEPRTQLLSPSNPSCLVQGHPQKPAADATLSWGKLAPSGKRVFKGFLLGGHPSPARIRGRRVSSHGGFEGGQGKLSPPMVAMEILSLRGVRTFRVRDQPGLRLETPTKHGEQSPVSRLAGRTAGGRDMHPTRSPDMAHLPISEKNEMGLEGRVCLQSWKVLEVNRAARTWKRLWDREGSPRLNQEVPVRLLFGAGRSAAGWQGSGQSSGSGIEPSFFWGEFCSCPNVLGGGAAPTSVPASPRQGLANIHQADRAGH